MGEHLYSAEESPGRMLHVSRYCGPSGEPRWQFEVSGNIVALGRVQAEILSLLLRAEIARVDELARQRQLERGRG